MKHYDQDNLEMNGLISHTVPENSSSVKAVRLETQTGRNL